MFDFSSAWEEHSSLLETNIRSLQPSSDETFFSHENYNVFSCCMPKRRGGESKRHHLETTADSFPPLLSPLMSNNASAVPKAKTEPIFPEQSSNLVEQEEASFQQPNTSLHPSSQNSPSDLHPTKQGKQVSSSFRRNSLGGNLKQQNFSMSLRSFRDRAELEESRSRSSEEERLRNLKAQIRGRRNSTSSDILVSGRGRYPRSPTDS